MKLIKEFGIIIIISFIGEILKYIIPLPIPASIYGLIIMFALLKTKILPLSSVKNTGKFLIEIMPLMFIPAAVSLINSWQVIKPIFIPLTVITLISTTVIMAVTGRFTQLMLRQGAKKNFSKDVE